jgi:hypothetical protein
MRNVRAGGLLYSSSGEPRLVLPGLGVALAAFLVALSVITFTHRPRTEEERAQSLIHSGHPGQGERIYARLLRERPTVPLFLAFLEAHQRALAHETASKKDQGPAPSRGATGLPDPDKPMSDLDVEVVLRDLPDDVGIVAKFAQARPGEAPKEVRDEIVARAAREPPVPWANHLLGREAEREGHYAEAARLYEKEGLASADLRPDVDLSLELWIMLEDWEMVRDRLTDPRVAAAASARPKYQLAVHDRDWRTAARWIPGMWAPRFEGTGVAMSALTALAWAFFCARLGKLGSRVRFRLPMYFAAFALGVASVVPTVLLIAVEEAKLRLVETGDPARDVLFFVFGVGLREEASKLLLFLPLLPILRRWGDKLDVLVCGAMVGLGFAAEENLGYLAAQNLHTGLGRFLTANFFHMALTGTLASALDDFVADPERNASEFSRTALFIVAIHGGYDFLLSHERFGGSYFAMAAFFFLTRLFLGAVDTARRRADRGMTPLHAFVIAVGAVTGVSFAYAVVAVGPTAGLLMMAGGLLGEAIIVYAFVRSLRDL